jgi:hypothetical protein
MNAETKTKSVFESGLDELRTLRDEVRLKLHLAGKDVKDQWESTFEPRIEKLEQQARSASDNTVDAMRDALDQAKDAFKWVPRSAGRQQQRRRRRERRVDQPRVSRRDLAVLRAA